MLARLSSASSSEGLSRPVPILGAKQGQRVIATVERVGASSFACLVQARAARWRQGVSSYRGWCCGRLQTVGIQLKTCRQHETRKGSGSTCVEHENSRVQEPPKNRNV